MQGGFFPIYKMFSMQNLIFFNFSAMEKWKVKKQLYLSGFVKNIEQFKESCNISTTMIFFTFLSNLCHFVSFSYCKTTSLVKRPLIRKNDHGCWYMVNSLNVCFYLQFKDSNCLNLLLPTKIFPWWRKHVLTTFIYV